jgi:hypothetical protein
MRIFSYLERRKIKKLLQKGTFESDLFKVETSIRFRPNNWIHWSQNGRLFEIENKKEHMTVWLAKQTWGLSFTVDGRNYGGVKAWSVWFGGWHIPWRRRLYRLGTKAFETKWIKNGPF